MIYIQRIYYDFIDDGCKDIHMLETDFVLNYICTDYKHNTKIIRTEELFDIRNYDPETFGNNIFVFDYRTFSVDDIEKLVKIIRPKIIIMLSDEAGHWPMQIWNDTLSQHCKLFIREYRHATQKHIANTMYLPCGFSNYNLLTTDQGVFNPNWYNAHTNPKKLTTERKIHWSFLGNHLRPKNPEVSVDILDRAEIIDIMQELPRGLWGPSKDGNENVEIYKDSVFVLNMRGWCGVRTTRTEEAMMTGAIPVVVCTPEEREISFYGQSDAPWVWANTWEEAREECNRLLHDTDALLQQQKNLEVWWNDYLQSVRDAIKTAMNSTD